MSLMRYIVKRTLEAIPTILAIITINFLILNLAPGDPAYVLAGYEAPREFVERLREQFGLNRPLHERYILYVLNVIQGNLGRSYTYNAPVIQVIAERIPATLLLTGTSTVIAMILGLILGIIASKKPFTKADVAVSITSLVFYSLPTFWTGIMFIMIFSLYLGLFPTQGMYNPQLQPGTLEFYLDLLHHAVLPVITLALVQIALFTRITRVSMLEAMREDYVVTALAKGLDDNTILYKHVLRNAALPIVTVFGLRLGFIFAGAIIVETVYAWPGVGRLIYGAILSRDYPLIMGSFFILSLTVIASMILTDILYAFLDPRVRLK